MSGAVRRRTIIRRAASGDRGASTLEYGAILMMIVAIVGAFTAIAIPQNVADSVSYSLCVIFHAGDTSKCETHNDKNYKPKACTVESSTGSYGSSLDIAFFQVGKNVTFIRSTDST